MRSPPRRSTYGALAMGDAPLEKRGEPLQDLARWSGGLTHGVWSLALLKPELDERVSVTAFVWCAVAAEECAGEGRQGVQEVRPKPDVHLMPAKALLSAPVRNREGVVPQ